MSDISVIDVSVLKDYNQQFNQEKNSFKNSTYQTFLSSYLKSCSDPYVLKMSNNLDNLYSKIDKGYQNIDKWWSSYNENVEGVENRLSSNNTTGNISESAVRSAVDQLVELKDYNSTDSGISSNVSSTTSQVFVSNSAEDISATYVSSNVKSPNVVNATVSNDVVYASSGVAASSRSGNIEEESWLQEASNKIWGIVKSVGATIAVFVQSLIEGLYQFCEAIVDFLALAGTAVASIFTGLYDGGQAIYGAITGKEWSSVTKKMWEGTKGFVAIKYTTGLFDLLYQNTSYGKWLAENAYGFNVTRSIGVGVGYVAGVVLLTLATFGIGGAAAGGGTAAGTAAGAAAGSAAGGLTVTAGQLATTAAVAGMGRGTQDAWADGAGIGEGLLTGAVTGAWEGFQFYVGAKINQVNVFGSNGLIKSVGGSATKTNVLNSLARVLLDGADEGLEGFATPLISMIYKDGYYDDNGNYVEFSSSDSFGERYSEVFNDNGGWTSVLTGAAIGSFASLIGEGFDLTKMLKSGDSDVKFSSSSSNSSSNNGSKMVGTKNQIYYDKNNPLLIKFNKVWSKGSKSNQHFIDMYLKVFNDKIAKNDVEAIGIFNRLKSLKKKDSKLSILSFDEIDKPYYDHQSYTGNTGIFMQEYSYGTLFHETGHLLFIKVLEGKLPNNWDSILDNSISISSKNGMLNVLIGELEDINLKVQKLTDLNYSETLKYKYRMNEFQYKNYLATTKYKDPKYSGIDSFTLADWEIKKDKEVLRDMIYKNMFGDYVALSDIVSSVFGGKDLVFGNKFYAYGHYSSYYKLQKNNAFHEIIANFTQLRLTGKPESLALLRSIFGDEFYNLLNSTFNKFAL